MSQAVRHADAVAGRGLRGADATAGSRRRHGEATTGRRRRRSADAARDAILAAAERRLVAGGPGAIRVQAVARDLGMTDAAIHYHFGSQDGLIEALIRHAGRRLKQCVAQAVRRWDAETVDVHALVDLLGETYGERGYGRLAAWMLLAGWKTRGAGMYRELAEAIHAARVRRARRLGRSAPTALDTQHTIALLNLVVFAEALAGAEMRRSVGLAGDRAAARRFRAWLGAVVERHLSAPAGDRPGRRAP